MTAVRNKFLEYEGVSKRAPMIEKEVRTEVLRYFRRQMSPKQKRLVADFHHGTQNTHSPQSQATAGERAS